MITFFCILMTFDLCGLGVCFFFVDSGSQFASYLAVALVMLFVLFFEFSLGPIPWIYMSEIMTDKGLSIAVLINWLTTLMLSIVTPYLISGYMFIFFGIIAAIV